MSFKINDKFTAYYARLFHAYHVDHPVLSKIFELRSYDEEYKDEFWQFHKANPDIYRMFKEQVMIAYNKGETNLSSKQILGWIRWEVKKLKTVNQ